MLPLELDGAGYEPPLSMIELKTSMYFPLETLTFSPSGENMLFSAAMLVRFTANGPMRVLSGTFGGFGVSNRGCVADVVRLPADVKGSSFTIARWSSTEGCVPLSSCGGC